MASKTDGLTIDDLAQHPEVRFVARRSVKGTVRELALVSRFDEKDSELYLREIFPLYSKLHGEGINIDQLLQEESPSLKRFWDVMIARQKYVAFSELEMHFLYHDLSLPVLLVEEHYKKIEQRAQPGGPRPNEITGLYYALLRNPDYNIKTVKGLIDHAMKRE